MYLVYDVGGTFIKFAIVNRAGDILEKGKTPTPYTFGFSMPSVEEGVNAFMDVVVNFYKDFKKKYDIEGIALAMPGQVDVDNGIAYGCGALPYLDKLELGKLISKRCDGLRVAMENDGKCAALAEVWKGNAKTCNNAVVIVFGTGIGGGIVVDRKVVRGRGMVAGEMSFMYEDVTRETIRGIIPLEDNLKRKTGMRLPKDIIWTSKSSVHSLREKVAKAKGMTYEETTGEKIYELDDQKDPVVHEILESWYLDIAKHCMNFHVMLAPDIILIGGGISAQPKFIEGIEKYVRILSKLSIIYDEMNLGLCKFGNDSNLYGALFNYLQKYEGEV